MATENMEKVLERHDCKKDSHVFAACTFFLPAILVLFYGVGSLIVESKFIWWTFAPSVGFAILYEIGKSVALIRILVGLLIAGETFFAGCIAVSAFVGHPVCGIGFSSTGFFFRLIGVPCGIYAVFGISASLTTLIGVDNLDF